MKFNSISFLLSVSFFSVVGHASVESMNLIHCLDSNPSNQAPVFFDAESGKFELGNFLSLDYEESTKSTTAYGAVTSISENEGKLTLKGSFGISLVVDVVTGNGTVSGLVKYDPSTGAQAYIRIKDHTMKCEITR